VTIHRALAEGDRTCVGHDNMIMVGAHVGHDCQIGDHTVMVNNVMLAGHVRIDDRAYLGGATGVHQFCRVGSCAMVGGMARLNRDVLPYVTVDGACAKVVGLNLIGLRRNGFSRLQIADIKEAYQIIYRRDLKWDEVVPELKSRFAAGPVTAMTSLLESTERGMTPEGRERRHTTIKIKPARVNENLGNSLRKAG